jgi:beta-glucosidase
MPATGRDSTFPPGFLFGAATSSHQVEGGNRWNDWWEAEQAGRLPHASGDACRHYELYERDFDLARSLGHNAHRLSIEWSRIEPEPGRWDGAAIEHYRDVLAALRARGLEPIVTLHHFTNPAWLAREGGWERRGAVRHFERYVDLIARELGEAVHFWITINEPTVYALHAYVHGEWPPFQRSWLGARRVLKNLLRAHTAAFRVLRERCPDARVGLSHSAPHVTPCDPRRLRDRLAAAVRDHLLNEAYVPPADELDFLGLNYYTRALVRSQGFGAGALFGRACKEAHHTDRGPLAQTGWEVHAPGLSAVLARFARLCVPLMVTENGIATEDETLRRQFLRDHLAQVAEALAAGIDVRGYLWWSLIDNFEWALGKRPRFGLAAVDFATQERRPRPAAEDFERVCRTGRLEPDEARTT